MTRPRSTHDRQLGPCLGLFLALLSTASAGLAQVTVLAASDDIVAYESPELGEELIPSFVYTFPEPSAIFAIEHTADGRLWGIDSSSSPPRLVDIDLENQEAIPIATVDNLCQSDLAISPSGTVWCSFPGEIRRLEPPLYETTQIVDVPGSGVGISFLGDRLFVSWEFNDLFLGEVNQNTGAITTLGTIEIPEDAQNPFGHLVYYMSFDSIGRLWMSIFNPGGFPNTGDSTLGMLPDIFESLEIDAVSPLSPTGAGAVVALGTRSVVNVPTASAVGLATLALLLAALGAWKLRAR
ncbi:MAG: hypothetical protein AAFY88_25285 [Acidobacteriota bacterium]